MTTDDLRSIYDTVGIRLSSGVNASIGELIFNAPSNWKISCEKNTYDNGLTLYLSVDCGMHTHAPTCKTCRKCAARYVHNPSLGKFNRNHPVCPVCKDESLSATVHRDRVYACKLCNSTSYICWDDMVTYVSMYLEIGRADK